MKKYSLPFLLFLTICLLVTCKTFDAVDVYTDPAYDDTEVLQALLTQKAADVHIQKHPENRPYIVRPL